VNCNQNCNKKGFASRLARTVSRPPSSGVCRFGGQARHGRRTYVLDRRGQPPRDDSSDSGLLLRDEVRPRLVVRAEVDQLVGHVRPLRVLSGKAPLAELLQILDLHIDRGQVKTVERERPLTDHPSGIRFPCAGHCSTVLI
jgi:hypothetical protein